MSQVFNKIKEVFIREKKTIIIIGVLLIAGIIAWDVFRPSNNRSGVNEVRTDLQSVGEQQQRAGGEIRESQRIVTEIRETNKLITREIDSSRELNKSSSELITEGKSIFNTVRARDKE